MRLGRLLQSFALLSREAAFVLALGFLLGVAPVCLAQDSSGNSSWSASSQQENPSGSYNPTRTSETHSQARGRVVDRTSVETLGPDGRYIPYSDTEKESVRVNDTTVRTIERTFGRDPDGQRVLIQERQEESRSLPGGEEKVVRTTSSPDANGTLQVTSRELEDSKQVSPGVRVTNTTVLTPDVNGGFSPAVRIEQRERKSSDGTVETTKSTSLANGTGGWQLGEVRETTSTQSGQERSKEERVLRPDADGKLVVVDRTVSSQTEVAPGEKRNTVETYSTNVPGQAGNDSLQLVQRETAVSRTALTGQSTTRQIEQPSPGDPSGSLHVTEEAIDIVQPNGSGKANETRAILTPGSDGQMGQVWIDTGKTGNPSAIQVDTRGSAKPK